jgi:hypothetical protein
VTREQVTEAYFGLARDGQRSTSEDGSLMGGDGS